MPLAFMSSMRASTFQQPLRSWSSDVGSMPYSSGGRPATAFKPTLGIWLPSNSQTSLPSVLRSRRGALSFHFSGRWLSNMSGGSQTWSSTLTRIISSIFLPIGFLLAASVAGFFVVIDLSSRWIKKACSPETVQRSSASHTDRRA